MDLLIAEPTKFVQKSLFEPPPTMYVSSVFLFIASTALKPSFIPNATPSKTEYMIAALLVDVFI